MKRWFRPVAYSIIALLVVLAIFGDKTSAGEEQVGLAPAVASVARAPLEPLPVILERKPAAFPMELFMTEQAVLAPVSVVPPSVSTPPPRAEIKVLGWMVSEAVPYAFIEWKGTSHTLALNEAVEDTFRFDAVGGGTASFTYLPTGEVRQYPVSNPDAQE